MTKKSNVSRHHFSVNFFGAIGYVALLFVWLLVLTATIGLFAVSVQPEAAATTSFSTLVLGDVATRFEANTAESTKALDMSVQLGLLGLLGVLGWIFFYFVSKVASRFVRHFLKLFGMKLTVPNLTTFKYFVAATGLIGLVVLLQFFPGELGFVKVAIALLGFSGGIVAVAAIYVQQVLALRYNAAITHVL